MHFAPDIVLIDLRVECFSPLAGGPGKLNVPLALRAPGNAEAVRTQPARSRLNVAICRSKLRAKLFGSHPLVIAGGALRVRGTQELLQGRFAIRRPVQN